MNRRSSTELAGSTGLGAWAAFGVLTMVVVGAHGAPLFLDDALLHWSLGHRPAVALAVARALTATGTGVVPYALVAVAALVAGRSARQRLVAVLLGAVCLGAGQAARYGVMELVARARPPLPDWRTHASGWAYPSGHSTTAALTAGLVILAVRVRAPRGRTPICLAVGCWGMLVGLTRVHLGVHWFTDVLGGWLFAVGWLGICLCAAAWWLPARLVTGPADTTNAVNTANTVNTADTNGTADRTDPAHSAGPADSNEPAGPASSYSDSDSTGASREEHASQDPGRRGRPRPA
ncbi:phosphatase PAP2 family protein [Streptomyces shenzhenensis]|uniref:phosphatase PAP2 family protein n=1 Tax=Streptomyces shenzhenensis TaxID=943815 RepID=UPI0038176C4E